MLAAGCGTTRWSDTPRTGTEQLLLSTAVDRAINNIDFKPLAGKDVYFDTTYLDGIIDRNYVISSLRQHLLASGCVLKADRKEATYVVEARAGAVGTNRQEVMLGVPAFQVPSMVSMVGVPSAVPEIPFAKTTDQKGIAKIAVFAYNQTTGQPVWQSGVFPVVSNAKDSWFLGAGPFQRGSIYDETKFAGSRLIFSRKKAAPQVLPPIPVTAEAVFEERPVIAREPSNLSAATPPAEAATPGSPAAPAASAATPAAVAAAGPTPGSSPPPGGPAAPEAVAQDAPPVGRIVRLPPLEQAARAEIREQAALEARENQPPAAVERLPDIANEVPARNSEFSLFSPSTWFR